MKTHVALENVYLFDEQCVASLLEIKEILEYGENLKEIQFNIRNLFIGEKSYELLQWFVKRNKRHKLFISYRNCNVPKDDLKMFIE